MSSGAAVVETTREYYDSDDADNFYFHVWGGEDIHVGLYDRPEDAIRESSHKTVRHMMSMLEGLGKEARILDIGSGYAGSARVLAKEHGCKVTALNLSPVQNQRARQLNAEQGLAELIEVIDGSFESLPFDDASYDIVWCQDAILHSANRDTVFSEVDRVLVNGGQFIFTDPMQKDVVDAEVLQPVLDRIHLPSMGSIKFYREQARALNWSEVAILPLPEMLVRHYSAVLRELEARTEELSAHCSKDYIERMKNGLRHWISAGQKGALDWGILHFAKN